MQKNLNKNNQRRRRQTRYILKGHSVYSVQPVYQISKFLTNIYSEIFSIHLFVQSVSERLNVMRDFFKICINNISSIYHSLFIRIKTLFVLSILVLVLNVSQFASSFQAMARQEIAKTDLLGKCTIFLTVCFTNSVLSSSEKQTEIFKLLHCLSRLYLSSSLSHTLSFQ